MEQQARSTRKERRAERYLKSRCEGKFRHPTQKAAENEATRLGPAHQPYHCPLCGGWHIGRG